MAGLTPNPMPMPISATPMVPAADHELPIGMATIAVMRQDVSRNTEGLMSFSPQ